MKTNILNEESTKTIFCIILLFIVSFVVFAYTVEIREPWFGQLSDEVINGSTSQGDEWLTGSTLKFSENWYFEGPLNLKFAMLENPRSIEFQTLSSRDPYTSYPPGVIIPIYIISKIVGHKPTPSLVMEYNLLNHFLVAFFLSMIIFFFLRQLKIDFVNSFLFSVIPIFIELLLPGPLYWFQNVFFTDQAVILPFCLYIFMEVVKDSINNNKTLRFLNIFQNIILFYGFLTDWLFVFIALTVYIKRIIDDKIVLSIYKFIKESIKFWFVPLLVLFLFILQVYILGNIGQDISKFLFRAGISQDSSKFLYNGFSTFLGHMSNAYGNIGVAAVFISLYVFILISIIFSYHHLRKQKVTYNNEKVKRTLYLIGMLLLPCILQVYFFKNHSVVHDFSVLKFSVPLSTIPFVLLPLLIFFRSENNLSNKFNYKLNIFRNIKIDFNLFIIFLLVFTAASFYMAYEHPNYKSLFPEVNNNYVIVSNSIWKNTGYNDVVFSPDFWIPENPPQALSYSMKRVYYINSPEDLKNTIIKLNSSYQIVVMFSNPPSNDWIKFLDNATLIKNGNISYYYLK
jgi:hypothetical protein